MSSGQIFGWVIIVFLIIILVLEIVITWYVITLYNNYQTDRTNFNNAINNLNNIDYTKQCYRNCVESPSLTNCSSSDKRIGLIRPMTCKTNC